tara:strand:+ start:166 stop:801 length:636 start_codon:yes stop_codon:yes gene_type:complete
MDELKCFYYYKSLYEESKDKVCVICKNNKGMRFDIYKNEKGYRCLCAKCIDNEGCVNIELHIKNNNTSHLTDQLRLIKSAIETNKNNIIRLKNDRIFLNNENVDDFKRESSALEENLKLYEQLYDDYNKQVNVDTSGLERAYYTEIESIKNINIIKDPITFIETYTNVKQMADKLRKKHDTALNIFKPDCKIHVDTFKDTSTKIKFDNNSK